MGVYYIMIYIFRTWYKGLLYIDIDVYSLGDYTTKIFFKEKVASLPRSIYL